MSFFVMGSFCTHHSNCVLHWLLTWHFYMKMMHFQYLYFQLKKRYYSFFEKVFIFQIICLKVKVLKTFETFIDCHIKTWPHLSPRAILKIPSTILTVFARRNTTTQLEEIISVNELKDALFSLKINKRAGYHGISFNVVKILLWNLTQTSVAHISSFFANWYFPRKSQNCWSYTTI